MTQLSIVIFFYFCSQSKSAPIPDSEQIFFFFVAILPLVVVDCLVENVLFSIFRKSLINFKVEKLKPFPFISWQPLKNSNMCSFVLFADNDDGIGQNPFSPLLFLLKTLGTRLIQSFLNVCLTKLILFNFIRKKESKKTCHFFFKYFLTLFEKNCPQGQR